MKLQELFEAKSGATVVAKMDIAYIDHNDRDKNITVTVFQDLKTPERAAELVAKLKAIDDKEGAIDVDYDKFDDSLYHMAQNGGGNISSVHGSGYIDFNTVKIVPKAPALARKVFTFNLSELVPEMNEGKSYSKSLAGTKALNKKLADQEAAEHKHYYATGKKGTHIASGEASEEYAEDFGDGPTGKRKWKLASGRWVNEGKNHLGDTEYNTWSGWRAAAKKKNPEVWFEGDKDIAQAMVGPKPYKHGETKAIGEWDGEKGSIYTTQEEDKLQKARNAAEAGRGQSAKDFQVTEGKQRQDRRDSAMVKPHQYSAKILHRGKAKMWPSLKGELYEKDVLIGTFARGAVHDGYVPPITYKFRTEAARNRFDDFADSLSIEETIEALLPMWPGKYETA